jgi:hypothetical protein
LALVAQSSEGPLQSSIAHNEMSFRAKRGIWLIG